MKTIAALLACILWIWTSTEGLPAQPPAQFRAWGTVGPEFPRLPAGWTEEPAEPQGHITPLPGEEKQGYIIFARDPSGPVPPTTVPAPSERTGEISASAAKGEYVPLTLELYALEELKDMHVSASSLKSAGSEIPADHLDVRVVRSIRAPSGTAAKRYTLQPFLLEKRDSFSVPGGHTAQLWITVKAPEEAQPGEYSGTISIQRAGEATSVVKLRVRVLPFTLPPSPIPMILYFEAPQSGEMLTKELEDLREHGVVPDGMLGARIKSRDRHYGEDDIAFTTAENKRIMNAIRSVYGGWPLPVTYDVGNQVIQEWDPVKGWASFWPHSKAIDDDFERAARVGIDLGKSEGWPPLRLFALDEAGAHNLLDEATYYYGLSKARLPRLETYTTIGGGTALGHDETGKLGPLVDFLTTNRFTPEIARTLVARGKPFGVYNGAHGTPAGIRYFFGFYGWKTAAQEIGQWHYHFGDAIFRGNGIRAPDEGYVYEAPDGPLPSIMLEAVREGVDDYRYTQMLWQRIGTARKSARPGARQAADQAEQALRSLSDKIPMTYQALTSEDSTPPPLSSALREWRGEVIRQILSLQAYAPEVSAGPVRRSPFDFAWPAPPVERLSYGPELLPAVDFATDLKPWMVQAWSGKGTGEVDTTLRHNGKASVRIQDPNTGSTQDVTVLVWPSWGESKLNVRLEADRTYELSAWVKFKDRGTPPALRINLPAAGSGPVHSGVDPPEPSGWQRLWTRTQVKSSGAPGYLAVWVQGPGVVWVEGLSLREVVPTPVKVSSGSR